MTKDIQKVKLEAVHKEIQVLHYNVLFLWRQEDTIRGGR